MAEEDLAMKSDQERLFVSLSFKKTQMVGLLRPTCRVSFVISTLIDFGNPPTTSQATAAPTRASPNPRTIICSFFILSI